MIEQDKNRFLEELTTLSLLIPRGAPNFKDQQTGRKVGKEYWLELSSYALESFLEACQRIKRREEYFPTISKLVAYCDGIRVSHEDVGVEFVNRAEYSIGSYGYSNPEGARKYLGELFWEVIQSMGGWSRFCDIDSYDQLPSLRAQWRKTATLHSKSREGKNDDDKPQGLPRSGSNVTAIETANKLLGKV